MSYVVQRAFRDTKNNGDDSIIFRQFIWERGVPGCSTS